MTHESEIIQHRPGLLPIRRYTDHEVAMWRYYITQELTASSGVLSSADYIKKDTVPNTLIIKAA